MIDYLLRALGEARSPDRELDCLLHECLTGQIDQCKDQEQKRISRQQGHMLLERGSEILWITIPRYTENVDDLTTIIPKDITWSVAILSDNHPHQRYGSVIFRKDLPPLRTFSRYRLSLALAQAIVLYTMAPRRVQETIKC